MSGRKPPCKFFQQGMTIVPYWSALGPVLTDISKGNVVMETDVTSLTSTKTTTQTIQALHSVVDVTVGILLRKKLRDLPRRLPLTVVTRSSLMPSPRPKILRSSHSHPQWDLDSQLPRISSLDVIIPSKRVDGTISKHSSRMQSHSTNK